MSVRGVRVVSLVVAGSVLVGLTGCAVWRPSQADLDEQATTLRQALTGISGIDDFVVNASAGGLESAPSMRVELTLGNVSERDAVAVAEAVNESFDVARVAPLADITIHQDQFWFYSDGLIDDVDFQAWLDLSSLGPDMMTYSSSPSANNVSRRIDLTMDDAGEASFTGVVEQVKDLAPSEGVSEFSTTFHNEGRPITWVFDTRTDLGELAAMTVDLERTAPDQLIIEHAETANPNEQPWSVSMTYPVADLARNEETSESEWDPIATRFATDLVASDRWPHVTDAVDRLLREGRFDFTLWATNGSDQRQVAALGTCYGPTRDQGPAQDALYAHLRDNAVTALELGDSCTDRVETIPAAAQR